MKAFFLVMVLALALAGGVFLLRSDGGRNGASTPAATQPAGPIVYRTDPGLEPDTCVAAWILTRLVSPGATVVVSPESPNSVPFDVPDSELSRRPGMCTSRVIVERYAIREPYALALTDVAQELEIAPWTTNSEPFFLRVRGLLGELLNDSPSDQVCLDKALSELDRMREGYPDEAIVAD